MQAIGCDVAFGDWIFVAIDSIECRMESREWNRVIRCRCRDVIVYLIKVVFQNLEVRAFGVCRLTLVGKGVRCFVGFYPGIIDIERPDDRVEGAASRKYLPDDSIPITFEGCDHIPQTVLAIIAATAAILVISARVLEIVQTDVPGDHVGLRYRIL